MLEKKTATRTLKAIFYAHEKWLGGDQNAVSADLRGMDLSQTDLRGFNLCRANLARVNLEGANLTKVPMVGANLSGANLHCAKLKGADLQNAVLTRCSAQFVSFEEVNLSGADLYGADLSGADLSGAQFGDEWTDNLQRARLNILPQGDIIGWKQLRGGKIAKLRIPATAQRSNGFGRRCRAEFAEVLSIIDDSNELCSYGFSKRDGELKYEVGQTVRPDGWDDNWKNDCTHGINFFPTYEEAEVYGGDTEGNAFLDPAAQMRFTALKKVALGLSLTEAENRARREMAGEWASSNIKAVRLPKQSDKLPSMDSLQQNQYRKLRRSGFSRKQALLAVGIEEAAA